MKPTPFDPLSPTTDAPARPLALSAHAAAEMLGISARTLWTLTNAGEIPHARIGRRVVYPLADLESWLAARTKGGER